MRVMDLLIRAMDALMRAIALLIRVMDLQSPTYNSHDLHDGLRAKLFTDDDIMRLPLIEKCYDEVDKIYPNLDLYRRRHEALRRFFGILVEDVISSSKNIILELSPNSIEDIRNASGPVIRFSDKKFLALKEIKSFLFNNMYRSPKVIEMR